MEPGFQYFWIYGADLKDWCSRYDLEIFVGICTDCGRELAVDGPFFGPRGIRGLGYDVCDCGNPNTPFEFISDDIQKLG
jgi:hypothetical protein